MKFIQRYFLYIALSLIGIIGGGIIWLTGELTRSDLIATQEELAMASQERIVALAADDLEELFDTIQSQLELLSHFSEVENGSTGECSAKMKEIYEVGELNLILTNIGRVGKDRLFDCSILDNVVGIDSRQYDYINEIFEDPNYPEHRPSLSRAIAYEDESGDVNYFMSIHIPLFNEDELVGTLGGAFFLKDIQMLHLSEARLPEGGFFTLIDDNGDVLYHPNPDFVGRDINDTYLRDVFAQSDPLKKIIEESSQGLTGSSSYTFNGETRIGAYAPAQILSERYWAVTAAVPQQSITIGIDEIINRLADRVLATTIIGVLLAFIIIWMQVRAESRRQRVEELDKFKLAADNAFSHIIITDPEGMIIYANDAVERVTGFSPEEVVGKKAGTKELWGGQMDKAFYKKMWDTIKNKKKSFVGELTNKRKNGTLYEVEAIISPVLNDKGRIVYFVGIERDITQQKRLERAKSEFVSLAAHQLRTPLTSIKWALELLLEEESGNLNKKQKDLMDNANDSNERMIRLINDLLNVSRIEAGGMSITPISLDLIKLCEEVIEGMRPFFEEKNQKFEFKYDKKIPQIFLDKDMIREAIVNLLSNANKYTHEGGQIILKIHMNKKDVHISVKDNGIGIPEIDKSQVFKKFYRSEKAVSAETEGTGLGLFMVKSIVEASGGRIWFESTEEKGSIFTMSLPLAGSRDVKS